MQVVPLGEDTCVVSHTLTEKIGLPQYSNVDIGPITITRIVKDDPMARAAAFAEIDNELREAMGDMRRATLSAIKAFAETGGYGDVRSKS